MKWKNLIKKNVKMEPNHHLDPPEARWGHTLTISALRVIIIGGYNNEFLSDVIIFDLTKMLFIEPLIKINGKFERSNHSAADAGDNKSVILFGGTSHLGKHNDVWKFEINKNEVLLDEIQVFGIKPAPRSYHTANIIDKYMFIVGGESQYDLSEIIAFDTMKNIWIPINKEGYFPPVKFHSSILLGKSIYIFGGCQEKYLPNNNLFIIDLSLFINDISFPALISKVNFNKYFPEPRWGHSSVVYNGEMFIFGGKGNNISLNELWKYSISKNNWKLVKCKNENPAKRRRHACSIYDSTMILFGGFDGVDFLPDFLFIDLQKPIENSFTRKSYLGLKLSKILNEKNCSDLNIQCNNCLNVLACHKSIIFWKTTSQDQESSLFLQEIKKLSDNNFINIEKYLDNIIINEEQLKIFLKFIYCNSQNINWESKELVQIKYLSDALQLIDLSRVAQKYIEIILEGMEEVKTKQKNSEKISFIINDKTSNDTFKMTLREESSLMIKPLNIKASKMKIEYSDIIIEDHNGNNLGTSLPLLIEHSPFFKAKYLHNEIPKDRGKFKTKIDFFQFSTLQDFAFFLENDCFKEDHEDSAENLISLLVSANYFLINSLIEELNIQLSFQINSRSIFHLLKLAEVYNAKFLYDTCILYFAYNSENLFRDFYLHKNNLFPPDEFIKIDNDIKKKCESLIVKLMMNITSNKIFYLKHNELNYNLFLDLNNIIISYLPESSFKNNNLNNDLSGAIQNNETPSNITQLEYLSYSNRLFLNQKEEELKQKKYKWEMKNKKCDN